MARKRKAVKSKKRPKTKKSKAKSRPKTKKKRSRKKAGNTGFFGGLFS